MDSTCPPPIPFPVYKYCIYLELRVPGTGLGPGNTADETGISASFLELSVTFHLSSYTLYMFLTLLPVPTYTHPCRTPHTLIHLPLSAPTLVLVPFPTPVPFMFYSDSPVPSISISPYVSPNLLPVLIQDSHREPCSHTPLSPTSTPLLSSHQVRLSVTPS